MQKLNFRTRDYSRVYLTSDGHIGHQKPFIFQPRGFSSWQGHSDFIKKSILELTEDDLFFHFGDMFLNTESKDGLEFLSKIKAQTYLLFGNHPSIIKQEYKKVKTEKFGENCEFEVYPLKITENITVMGDHFYLSIDGKKFYCNHFPVRVWDGQQHGWGHLHGHCHSSLEGSQPDDYDGGKMLDAGIDNALKYNKTPFFSFQEIVEIMNKKPIKIYDHHEPV